MNKRDYRASADFAIEGRFLNFVVKDGYKIKALTMATATGEQYIKLSKEARVSLGQPLVPGEWIIVRGRQKEDDGELKLKAYGISRISPTAVREPEVGQPAATPKPQTILVCQKSDCCKRGAMAIRQMLEAEVSDRNLTGQVTIKGTGCMKECKAGPNVVMPDKTRHSRVRAHEVADLLDHHLKEPSQPQSK